MKKKITRIILLLILLISITGCKKEEEVKTYPVDVEYKSTYNGKQGSAGPLQGNTLVISIFASDQNTKWTDSKADKKAQKNVLSRLKVATEYLSKSAANYGKSLTFIYNWEKNPDLRYIAEFENNLVIKEGTNYKLQKSLIEKHISIKTLTNKYHADNIIYFFFLNTAFDNQIKPWTISHRNCDYCNIEFTNMYVREKGKLSSAATYAHEMMHQFGAPDFYVENEIIPNTYVEYLRNNKSKDIMFYINNDSKINCKFTDLDAYYVGIASRPSEANQWNLGKSEYESNS